MAIRMHLAATIAVTASAIVSAAPAAANDYTEDQMTLASQLGAVLALSGACPYIDTPTAGIAAAVNGAGLQMSDVLDATAFRTKMEEGSSNVNMMNQVRLQMGRTESELAIDACDNLKKMYGRSGTVRPGIIPVD